MAGSGMPLVVRAVVVGGLVAGVLGAATGLVVGLRSYAPTAWFAVVELGLPSAVLGSLVGLLAGSLVVVGQAVRRRSRP